MIIYQGKEKPFDENSWREWAKKLEIASRQEILPKNWDSYEPTGGIKLSIILEEIDPYVQDQFDALRKSGLLLRRSEFEQKYDSTKFCTPKKCYEDDLTRLWGAEYLREKLADKGNYRVPRVLIVIEDDAKTIPIKVVKNRQSIVIRNCDTKVAKVVVEHIEESKREEGYSSLLESTETREARSIYAVHGKMMESFGYIGFYDQANIQQGKDGKFYVINTTWIDALEGVVKLPCENLSLQDPTIVQLREYANERFHAYHTDEWETTIDVRINDL